MEMEIKVKGDLYEDRETLRIFVHAQELYSCIYEARQRIRTRIKYEEISEAEDRFLEELKELLWLDPIELG